MFVTKVKLTAGCVAVAALVSAMLIMAALPAVGQKPPLAVELRESIAPAKPATAIGEGDLQPDDVLAKAIKASREAAALTSFVGTAVFEHYVREPGQDEPMLRTKAKVKVYYDRGKYHLRFDYQTKLEFSVFPGEDLTKPRFVDGDPVKAGLVETKPRDFAIIFDGKDKYRVTIAGRIPFIRRSIEIEVEERRPELPFVNPALLGKRLLDLEQVLENRGRNSFTITRLADGGYRVRQAIKDDGPKMLVEFYVHPEAGWNVVKRRIFNPNDDHATHHAETTWKQKKGHWFGERLIETVDVRRDDRFARFTRSVFYFETFEPGAEVDAKLFSPASLPVPPGQVQEIDHRTNR
jgi:hypothetical protein